MGVKPLPCDEAAEKIAVGALMVRPECLSVLDEKGISASHFTDPRLFQIVTSTIEDSGRASFTDILPRLPEELRGVASECEQEALPLSSNVAEYADRILDAWRRRELILFARTVAANGVNGDFHEIAEKVRGIVDGAESGSSRLPAVVDACRLAETAGPLPEDLIEGILHRGSKLVLGGGSKSFKTWSLLDLAVSVATGSEWWDFETAQGRVLFVNFEIQAPFFAARLREICEAKGVTLRPGQLDVLNLRGFAASADVILPQITRRMMAGRYALAILDPLYKLLGSRDENASRDMADLMNAVERLAVRSGAAVAFGSHFAKGNAAGKESMDRISGSGVFARDPDSIVTMTRHEEEGAFTVEMTLRNHPPQDAFVVRRRHPLMVRDGGLDPGKLKQTGGRKQEVTADEVLDLLGDEPTAYSEWARKAQEELLISLPTFKRRVRELRDDGKVRRSAIEDGKYVKGSKGSVGVKTHLSPAAVGGVKTLIGFDPDPNLDDGNAGGSK
jgi:hypothetical protein